MGSMTMAAAFELPDASSPKLHLTHPTLEEREATWKLNFKSWGGPLDETQYIERETYLTTVPLARDGGVTHWILVDSSLPPNQRPILGSCESLRKRAWVSSKLGECQEVYTHGIGSVFCNPAYRGKRYASRMMQELGKILQTWQTTQTRPCLFSVLWSDIGKKFYAGHGWHPFPSSHISILPADTASSKWAQSLTEDNVRELCLLDSKLLRQRMQGKDSEDSLRKSQANNNRGINVEATQLGTSLPHDSDFDTDWVDEDQNEGAITKSAEAANELDKHVTDLSVKYRYASNGDQVSSSEHEKVRVAIIPDFENMQWHHMREDFFCQKLFNKKPTCKGGIAGPKGKRVWAIWTRTYCNAVDKPDSDNTLYILRLVIEDEVEESVNLHIATDETVIKAQALRLNAVLKLAQAQALEWKLQHVELWNPSQHIQMLIHKIGLKKKTALLA